MFNPNNKYHFQSLKNTGIELVLLPTKSLLTPYFKFSQISGINLGFKIKKPQIQSIFEVFSVGPDGLEPPTL